MKIRKATLEDFDKIYPIYMDKSVNPFMSFPVMDKEKFLPLFQNFLNDLFVYEIDHNIAGLMATIQLPCRNSHVAIIHKIAVNPDYRSQGIGSKLFFDIIPILKERGIKRLELRVESDNHNAIKFYKKIGFQIEGTLIGYYNREGEIIDGHLMGMLI